MRTFTFNNLEQHLVKNKLFNIAILRVLAVAPNLLFQIQQFSQLFININLKSIINIFSMRCFKKDYKQFTWSNKLKLRATVYSLNGFRAQKF